MSLASLENKSMIIHFLSIPTLSQPFNTVSSLFRMYSSIPCGQALLSAGKFFCGTKEEVIIIAKNIAMYLNLTNTSGICKQLSWSLEPLITALSTTKRPHYSDPTATFTAEPLFQWLLLPNLGTMTTIVFGFEWYSRTSLERYSRKAENVSATEGGRFQGNASHTQRVQTCLCQVELSANERYNVYSQGLDFKPSNKLHDRLVEQVPTVHPNKISCNCLYVQEEIGTCWQNVIYMESAHVAEASLTYLQKLMKLVDQREEHDIRSVNREQSWGHIRDPVYK